MTPKKVIGTFKITVMILIMCLNFSDKQVLANSADLAPRGNLQKSGWSLKLSNFNRVVLV